MSRILGILDYALAREEDGRAFYLAQTDKVKSKDVKDLFIHLGEMESDHVDYISTLIEKVRDGKGIQSSDVLSDEENFFAERYETELPAGRHAELASDISVLRMAYLIEHDFMLYYKKASENAETEAEKDILNHLCNWEKGHRDMVQKLYDEKMKAYWDEMGFEPLY
jgi:rubrerythrin